MPQFAVEVEYLVPVYQRVSVEAQTVAEACCKAVRQADEDWEPGTVCYDSSGASYANAVRQGGNTVHFHSTGSECEVPVSHGSPLRKAAAALISELDKFDAVVLGEQYVDADVASQFADLVRVHAQALNDHHFDLLTSCDDCGEDILKDVVCPCRLCTQCGARNDDGEGYDGLCGSCADRAESA